MANVAQAELSLPEWEFALHMRQVEGVARVDANDVDSGALEAMQRNLQWTGQDAAAIVHPMQVCPPTPSNTRNASACRQHLLALLCM